MLLVPERVVELRGRVELRQLLLGGLLHELRHMSELLCGLLQLRCVGLVFVLPGRPLLVDLRVDFV